MKKYALETDLDPEGVDSNVVGMEKEGRSFISLGKE